MNKKEAQRAIVRMLKHRQKEEKRKREKMTAEERTDAMMDEIRAEQAIEEWEREHPEETIKQKICAEVDALAYDRRMLAKAVSRSSALHFSRNIHESTRALIEDLTELRDHYVSEGDPQRTAEARVMKYYEEVSGETIG